MKVLSGEANEYIVTPDPQNILYGILLGLEISDAIRIH